MTVSSWWSLRPQWVWMLPKAQESTELNTKIRQYSFPHPPIKYHWYLHRNLFWDACQCTNYQKYSTNEQKQPTKNKTPFVNRSPSTKKLCGPIPSKCWIKHKQSTFVNKLFIDNSLRNSSWALHGFVFSKMVNLSQSLHMNDWVFCIQPRYFQTQIQPFILYLDGNLLMHPTND